MTQQLAPMKTRADRIEDKLDLQRASEIQVSNRTGGVAIQTMAEAMELAKLMAISDVAIPKHLRERPGACLAICIRAMEWRMNPYAVADKSYVVNDRLAFESQLIHAVIEQRAPLSARLRCHYSGEGQTRKCTVTGRIKGEADPFTYTSPEISRIQPKNSPLWGTKPDLQLFYNTSRDWARMYFPDVILGVYSEDEIDRGQPVVSAETTNLNKALEQIEQHEQPRGADAVPQQDSPAESTASAAPAEGSAADPDEDQTNPDTDQTQIDQAGEIVLNELIEQGEDAIKAFIKDAARAHNDKLSRTVIEGGIFKFTQKHGKTPDAWKTLIRAVQAGNFVFNTGAIVGEQ